jgi:adenine phosphoribosyltransferase
LSAVFRRGVLSLEKATVHPMKVLLVDDLIATGGTALAGVDLIQQGGGRVEQALFIVDLPDLGGSAKLRAQGLRVASLIGFDGD